MGDRPSLMFRSADSGDIGQLVEMALAFYREDPGGDPMSADKVRRTAGELRGRPDKGRIVMFIEDGQTVGYAILIYYWSNEYGGNIVFIDELFVVPRARGRGIATRYFQHLFHELGAFAVAFQLEVTPRNDRAKSLYARLGFRLAKNTFMFRRNRGLSPGPDGGFQPGPGV